VQAKIDEQVSAYSMSVREFVCAQTMLTGGI